MPEYSYVSRTPQGTIERGLMTGSNPAEVRDKITRLGNRLVGIQLARQRKLDWNVLSMPGWRRWISASQIELMLRQLAVMLSSGLELTESLKELQQCSSKKSLQLLCAELSSSVEKGNSFSDALAESRQFPDIVTQLVHVGEGTGKLSAMLQRAADFVQARREAMSSFGSAIAYPIVVIIAACSVAAYLVGWTIPKLAVFLNAMGRKLPSMTQSLLDVSSVIQAWAPQVLVLTLATVVASGLIYTWSPARYRIDQGLFRIPVIGALMRLSETQTFASSMAVMLRSGIFLPDALEAVTKLHRNRFVSARVATSREFVRKGSSLADALNGIGFGPMLYSMIAVGERTGELPRALEHVAKFYASLVDARIKRLSRMLEPAIIVIVGGMVGYVYSAFFMALLSAGGNFR